MSKDQILRVKTYAPCIEHNNDVLFNNLMEATFHDDPLKQMTKITDEAMQLDREDLKKVLNHLYELLKLDVDDSIEINGFKFTKRLHDDDRIIELIKDFKWTLSYYKGHEDFQYVQI